jgi:hypothetical protein
MEEPTTIMLKQLRSACLKAARPESSSWPSAYRKRRKAGTLSSPVEGHCGAIATMIHGMFGGQIMHGIGPKLQGLGQWTGHFWNRLPDGREIDLTSCQFGGDGMSPICSGEPETLPDNFLVGPEALEFAARVSRELSRNPKKN